MCAVFLTHLKVSPITTNFSQLHKFGFMLIWSKFGGIQASIEFILNSVVVDLLAVSAQAAVYGHSWISEVVQNESDFVA